MENHFRLGHQYAFRKGSLHPEGVVALREYEPIRILPSLCATLTTAMVVTSVPFSNCKRRASDGGKKAPQLVDIKIISPDKEVHFLSRRLWRGGAI